MTADDFFRAANERWEEAGCLYRRQTASPNVNLWIGTMFLYVVAVECLYTAFFVYEHGENVNFPVDHNLDALFNAILLKDFTSVVVAQRAITSYWYYWPKDLRYIDREYLVKRLIQNETTGNDIRSVSELIGETTYMNARTIIQEGRKEAQKLWRM